MFTLAYFDFLAVARVGFPPCLFFNLAFKFFAFNLLHRQFASSILTPSIWRSTNPKSILHNLKHYMCENNRIWFTFNIFIQIILRGMLWIMVYGFSLLIFISNRWKFKIHAHIHWIHTYNNDVKLTLDKFNIDWDAFLSRINFMKINRLSYNNLRSKKASHRLLKKFLIIRTVTLMKFFVIKLCVLYVCLARNSSMSFYNDSSRHGSDSVFVLWIWCSLLNIEIWGIFKAKIVCCDGK